MTPVVIKKPRAEQDLLRTYTYIRDRSLKGADRFLQEADSTFGLLARFPTLGEVWDSPSPHLTGVRFFTIRHFRNYVVFYRPIENGIEVLHVFHGRMNIRRLLEEE